jgi:hypothetical protein
VDDIANNFETIRDTEGFVIATSGEDELGFLRSAINAKNPGPVSSSQ